MPTSPVKPPIMHESMRELVQSTLRLIASPISFVEFKDLRPTSSHVVEEGFEMIILGF